MEPFGKINAISMQSNPIQSIGGLGKSNIGSIGGEDKESKKSFADLMSSQVKGISGVLDESVESKNQLVRGELKHTHDTAIAGQKAGIMLRMTTATLSKVSSACTTLFQMQI